VNGQEVTSTADALRRMLVLVRAGQMSEAAGCRIEGAVAALTFVGLDASSELARQRIDESIRRLTKITEAAEMTAATACRIDGALAALRSITESPSSLLARFSHPKREPLVDGARIPSHLGQRTTEVYV
jgi:hypothetical protein